MESGRLPLASACWGSTSGLGKDRGAACTKQEAGRPLKPPCLIDLPVGFEQRVVAWNAFHQVAILIHQDLEVGLVVVRLESDHIL